MPPAPERRPPVLDLAVLCAAVEYDEEGRPLRLVEPLHTVLITPDERGRLLAPEFFLYVQMTTEDAHGRFALGIEVRPESEPHLTSVSVEAVEPTFVSRYDPPEPFEHVFVIRDLAFPAPGWYNFHVSCRGQSLCDLPDSRPGASPARPARLRIIRAEAPEDSA